MNLSSLQTLAWSTVACAVAAALALASGDTVMPERERTAVGGPGLRLHLPTEPTAAGPSPRRAASAPGQGAAARGGSAGG